MKKTTLVKISSVLVNLLVGFLSAILVLYFQDWFGSGDTSSFIFWSIPLAVGIAVSGKSILILYRINNKLVRLLLSILVAGFIAFGYVYLIYLIIGPWINAFSIPIFPLWIMACLAQLLFLDWLLPKTTQRIQLIREILGCLAFPMTVVLTIIAVFVGSLAFEYITRPEKETYLIPRGFHGRITVVYGEAGGIVPEYEKGRRLLRIPDNGILIIQTDPEYGLIDNEYYFVDPKGTRTRIAELHGNDVTSRGIKLTGTGNMSDGKSEDINFTKLYVSDGVSTEPSQSVFKNSREHDSLVRELVDKCRPDIEAPYK